MIHCPHCNATLDDAPDLAGQFVFCPRCSKQFPMPLATAPAPSPASASTPASATATPLIDVGESTSRPIRSFGRPRQRADKAPRLALLVATICWPIASIGFGLWSYASGLTANELVAQLAMKSAISTVTGIYFIVVAICLAWWFYARD